LEDKAEVERNLRLNFWSFTERARARMVFGSEEEEKRT